MLRTLTIVYLIILLSSFSLGLFRIRMLDKASSIICILVGFNFLVESTSYITAMTIGNNMAVYGIATPIQTVLACLYFNYSIESFRRRNIGIVLASLSLVIGIVNVTFFQSLGHLPSYFLTYSGALIVSLTQFGYFSIFNSIHRVRLRGLPQVWFMATFLFFWTFTAIFWCAYDFYGQATREYAFEFNLFILAVNYVYYAAFGVIFLLYPKIVKQSNES